MSANNNEERPARILVIDDEAPITELLCEILLMMGHEPHSCNHPAEALARMQNENFELVLSDYRMPGMNGRQFYTAVQERCPRLGSRIVFLTGDVGSEDTQQFLDSLDNASLSKPFQFNEVIELITRLLKEGREDAIAA